MGILFQSGDEVADLSERARDALLELAGRTGRDARRLEGLDPYGDAVFEGTEVRALAAELTTLAAALEQELRDRLARERHVTARDPRVRDAVLGPMLAADRVWVDVVAVRDLVVAAGREGLPVTTSGD